MNWRPVAVYNWWALAAFETKHREPRVGRNPRTREAVEIPASTVPDVQGRQGPEGKGGQVRLKMPGTGHDPVPGCFYEQVIGDCLLFL